MGLGAWNFKGSASGSVGCCLGGCASVANLQHSMSASVLLGRVRAGDGRRQASFECGDLVGNAAEGGTGELPGRGAAWATIQR